jgi:hypothetical protein
LYSKILGFFLKCISSENKIIDLYKILYYKPKNLRLTIKGWRRFFVPELRNCAAVSRAQKNVGEQNTTKGVLAPKRTPGWWFANPEPPSGGEALTVC